MRLSDRNRSGSRNRYRPRHAQAKPGTSIPTRLPWPGSAESNKRVAGQTRGQAAGIEADAEHSLITWKAVPPDGSLRLSTIALRRNRRGTICTQRNLACRVPATLLSGMLRCTPTHARRRIPSPERAVLADAQVVLTRSGARRPSNASRSQSFSVAVVGTPWVSQPTSV